MWESVKKPAHGILSLRHITLLAISLMIALFAVIVMPPSTAFAVDAQRQGDTISYDGKTFTKLSPGQVPSDLPEGTTGYASIDTANNKAYFLMMSGPAESANTAVYTLYDPYTSNTVHGPPTIIQQAVTIVGSTSSSPAGSSNTPEAAASGSNSQTAADGVSTCNSDQTGGLGWILCPVVNFLAKSTDFIYKLVANFLVVRTITTDTNSSLYRMWDYVRSIANVCFIIVFLIIVYSQVTGYGIANYNLKKMLPRLIVGAILVNLSFWICALSVDVSNILGYSIHQLFLSVLEQFNTASAYEGAGQLTWQAVAVSVLSGGGIAVGAGYMITAYTFTGALFLLLPVLLGVIIAAIVALVVLAARQALIVCLIIISPLGFVAMLLPNTEKYFDKWRSVMTTMLLLYPIFSVIFSGAQLAGMAIIQNANGNIITVILGMAVQVAPIIITPLLVKFSGGLLGRIAGMVNNPNKGILDRTRKWSRENAEYRRNRAVGGVVMPDGTIRHRRRHAATRTLDTRRRAHSARRKAYEGLAEAAYEGTPAAHDIEAINKTAGNVKTGYQNAFAASSRGMRLELQSRNLETQKAEIENAMMSSPGGSALEGRTRRANIHKQEIGNTFDASAVGQSIRARQRAADISKVEIENAFDRNPINHPLKMRGKLAEIDKTQVENEFEGSRFGSQVESAKREVERTKQLIASQHEQAWHFRNQTDAESQQREMHLRITADSAGLGKAKVDALYAELKNNDSSSLMASIASTAKDTLAADAYAVSEQTILTQMRSNQATSELRSKVNNELLTNATTYQLSPDGTRVLDASGKPIILSQRHIDGKSLQEYAAGIGKQGNILATAIAEDRADWGKQAQAAGELIAHFKLESGQVQSLARYGKGTTVKAVDDHGNEFEFDADDEYVKEAAISKQFKEGSYSQKMDILMETGERVEDVDASGNRVIRKGHNFAHRSTAKSDAVASGIARLAPFINDVTYNEILKGNFNGRDSINMHGMRQIFEGRIKADNLAGANNEALDILTRLGELRSSSDPANQAEFTRYKDQMFDLFADMYGRGSHKYNDLLANFDTQFDTNYNETITTYQQILNNSNLSRETSLNSRKSMEGALSRNGYRLNPRTGKWER